MDPNPIPNASPQATQRPGGGPIQAWIAKAESGERFDLYCQASAQESTRARHDGRQLTLAHFVGSSPVGILHLRRGPDGQWRVLAAAHAFGLATADCTARAWSNVEHALALWEPALACGLRRRLLARM